jgi:hypothetical protein
MIFSFLFPRFSTVPIPVFCHPQMKSLQVWDHLSPNCSPTNQFSPAVSCALDLLLHIYHRPDYARGAPVSDTGIPLVCFFFKLFAYLFRKFFGFGFDNLENPIPKVYFPPWPFTPINKYSGPSFPLLEPVVCATFLISLARWIVAIQRRKPARFQIRSCRVNSR